MDSPCWSWPAWKFGLKRDDLFSSLHEQYNTFTFSIQDPEAFHADVNEISHDADTAEDFHRLMAERRRQRLQELHESLESLAIEIIANPKLMDSKYWDYAIQLFRTKSFDSLVRYFASYLPEGDLDPYTSHSERTSSSYTDASSVYTTSTETSSVDDAPTEVTPKDSPTYHHSDPGVDAPLSPPASEVNEEPISTQDFEEAQTFIPSDPPSPSMSFSGSESGPFIHGFRRSLIHDDDASSQSDCETAVTSVSDSAESRDSLDSVHDKEPFFPELNEEEFDDDDDEDDLLAAQFPEDSFDAVDDSMSDSSDASEACENDDTPTPRPDAITTSYVEYKSALPRRLNSPRHRSPSRSRQISKSPSWDTRRSPDEAFSKIQKPSPDPARKRPKGRI